MSVCKIFSNTITKSSSSLSFFPKCLNHTTKRHYSTTNDKVPLHEKKCIPCEGDIDPLDINEKIKLLKNLDKKWTMGNDNKSIFRVWRIPFPRAIKQLQYVMQIAEEEGHHPDVSITSYWNLKIEIFTHSINDLTENDFILASKIDGLQIPDAQPPTPKKSHPM
ncbi:hypothetical protein CYY_001797 [Polysphondylium violaceum]|uniref:4a-hydroxytetrahydrobiopterin dehydratase n=1 Tax=Polysphondylium violaceum TaxID=133409 RepID=A0A8J4Q159_9MYCE|nr:hypothetical protein CYY_001797 [Polysphondylium violaceum]